MHLVRQTSKALLHRPWYSASIIMTMAVGCALLTSVLAIVDGVLFKPLGYPSERDLVAIKLSSNRSPFPPGANPEDLDAWAQAVPGVALTGFRTHSSPVSVALVQPNFFDVLRVRPALGGFAPEDFERAASNVEPRIVTDEIFRAQFGGDSSTIGRTVILDPSSGFGYRVVGVMPPGFKFPTDLWPVGYLAPYVSGRYPPYLINDIIGRLPEDAENREVQARVLAVALTRNPARGPVTSPSNQPIDQVDVVPLGRALGSATRPLFAALLIGAGFLVAIAALNASSLMAARSVDRARELAVRRSLGATLFDVGQLLLTEAGLLMAASATIGVVIASLLLRVTAELLPRDVALFRTASIDWRIVAYSVLATALLTIVVVAWPTRVVMRGATSPSQARNVTGQARAVSWRLVVAAQVAIALVLTVAGSLLVGSLLSVYAQAPAITTRNVFSIPVQFLGMSTTVGREAPERATRVNALLDRVRTVPGVEAVALTGYDLLEHSSQGAFFIPPETAVSPRKAVTLHAVTADFYDVIQPQLTAGRWPTALELTGDDPVIVVSERVASSYWPNATALGQTLTNKARRDSTAMTFTVVGVVRDVRWAAWDEEALPTIYGPYALLARQSNSAVLMRVPANQSGVTAEALRVIGETDSLVRMGRVTPLDDLFADSVRPRRFRAWLFGSFALASLFVVGLGIFGQLAMATARRTREVGIRMACGATRPSIAILILREQLLPVLIGLAAGATMAGWAGQFVRSYLYQMTPSDARVWAAAIGLIILTAAFGTLIPALRASRIEVTKAVRAE